MAGSAANAEYCARVYGRNLRQHGFADLAHLDHLFRASGMAAGSRVLDLGCGSGMISEYFSDQTGAHVTGIDFIPKAIRDALARIWFKRDRLDFRVEGVPRDHCASSAHRLSAAHAGSVRHHRDRRPWRD